MLNSVYDIVVKIGSMALIHNEDGDLDYNIFSRLGKALAKAADEMEQAVKGGNTETLTRFVRLLKNQFAKLKETMEELK